MSLRVLTTPQSCYIIKKQLTPGSDRYVWENKTKYTCMALCWLLLLSLYLFNTLDQLCCVFLVVSAMDKDDSSVLLTSGVSFAMEVKSIDTICQEENYTFNVRKIICTACCKYCCLSSNVA